VNYRNQRTKECREHSGSFTIPIRLAAANPFIASPTGSPAEEYVSARLNCPVSGFQNVKSDN